MVALVLLVRLARQEHLWAPVVRLRQHSQPLQTPTPV
jgi:hypothetical protein